MSAQKSLYLDKDSLNKHKVVKPYKKILAPMGVFIIGLLLSLQFIIPNIVNMNVNKQEATRTAQIKTADAAAFGGVVCGDENSLGTAMDAHSDWASFIGFSAAEGKGGRDWTIDEAFGSSIAFADYTGEGGKETWLAQDVGEKRGDKIGNFSEIVKKLEEDRNAYNCIVGTGTTLVGNLVLNTSALITSLTQGITMLVFDSDFICTSADSKKSAGDSSHCFNILKVIGGDQGDGVSKSGIIGSLTTNLYLPLVSVVAILTGIWMAWIGLKNGKVREAFFGLAWAIGCFMLGYAMLLHPALVAKAPMKASNTLATCVVGAFNGGSCGDPGSATTSGGSTSGTAVETSAEVCKAGVSGADSSQAMALAMSGLTCQIWKAFVLEPYSNGSFGKSFEELDITDPKTSETIKKAKIDPNQFCISLHSDKSYDEMKGRTLELTGSKTGGHHVCNIAAYQLYLMTNATSGGDKIDSSKLDKRWYNVIVTAANDESMWNQWHTSWATGSDKILTAFLSLVASIFGGALLIVVSLFALMFYILAAVLMAFAPLFLLMGIHPGRGRNLLKGWAETVISNVLKYLASAVFLIVSISLYGGVLGNIQNIGMTLIFILVLTLALFMYRKEIIEMLGKVNMGGEKIANKMTGVKNNKLAKKASRIAKTGTGSAIGSVMANGGINKGTYAAAASGFSDGATRELKRGSGLVAGAVRERERLKKSNRNNLESEGRTAKAEAKKAEESIVRDDQVIAAASSDIAQSEAHLKHLENSENYNDVVARENQAQSIEGKVLHELSNVDPLFARFQALTNQLENLKFQQEILIRNGDMEGAAALQGQIDTVSENRDKAQSRMGERQMHRGLAMYEGQKREAFAAAGLGADYETRSDEYKSLVGEYSTAAAALANAYSAHNDAVADKRQHLDSKLKNEAAAELITNEISNLKSVTSGLKGKDLERIRNEADTLGTAKIKKNAALYDSEKKARTVDMSDHFGKNVNASSLNGGSVIDMNEATEKVLPNGNPLDKGYLDTTDKGKKSANNLNDFTNKDEPDELSNKESFKDKLGNVILGKEIEDEKPKLKNAYSDEQMNIDLKNDKKSSNALNFDGYNQSAENVKQNEEYHAEGKRVNQNSYGNLKDSINEDIRSGKFDDDNRRAEGERAEREAGPYSERNIPIDPQDMDTLPETDEPFENLSKTNPFPRRDDSSKSVDDNGRDRGDTQQVDKPSSEREDGRGKSNGVPNEDKRDTRAPKNDPKPKPDGGRPNGDGQPGNNRDSQVTPPKQDSPNRDDRRETSGFTPSGSGATNNNQEQDKRSTNTVSRDPEKSNNSDSRGSSEGGLPTRPRGDNKSANGQNEFGARGARLPYGGASPKERLKDVVDSNSNPNPFKLKNKDKSNNINDIFDNDDK